METKNTSERLLKAIVVLLAVGMLVQGVFIAKLYVGQKKGAASVEEIQKTPDSGGTAAALSQAQRILPPIGTANQSQGQNPAPGPGQSGPLSPPSLNQMMSFDDFFGNDDAFEHFRQMQEMMNRMMHRSYSSFNGLGGFDFGAMGGTPPNSKITEDKNNYIVKMKIPGLDKSEIKTEVNGDMLTVSGIQKEELQDKVGNRVVSRRNSERSFQSSFSLPHAVKPVDVKVDYEKDILTVRIPKA